MTRVLVVEDEESFSDALSSMLRKEGFEVAVCPTGPDALETFDRSGAGLVLRDLMLPSPRGGEGCGRRGGVFVWWGGSARWAGKGARASRGSATGAALRRSSGTATPRSCALGLTTRRGR